MKKHYYSLLLTVFLFIASGINVSNAQCTFSIDTVVVEPPTGPGCNNALLTVQTVSTSGYVFYDLYKDNALIQSAFDYQAHTFVGLEPGIYAVKVTNNGCIVNSAPVEITDPECNIGVIAVVGTPVSGNGCSDGAISVKPTGSNCGNYQVYLLVDDNFYADLTDLFNGEFIITGLPPGIYTLVVTTVQGYPLGCRYGEQVEITEPPCNVQIANPVYTNATAYGCLNGTIKCNLSGGVCGLPQVYVEKNGVYYADLNFTAPDLYQFNFLPAGNYQLIALNNPTCGDTLDFEVTQPACNIQVTNVQITDVTGASCGNGAISCTVGGNYCSTATVFLLKNGIYYNTMYPTAGVYSIGNLPGGTYQIVARPTSTITCADTVTAVVNEASCNLQITSVTIIQPGGYGCQNGLVRFKPLGNTCFGYSAYLVDDNFQILGTFDDVGGGFYEFQGLGAGSYTIYLTNSLGVGCTVTQLITVVNPPCNLAINNIQINPLTTPGCATASVSCTASGSVCDNGVYDVYLIKDGNFYAYLTTQPPSTVYSVSNLGAGQYILMLENGQGSGCSVSYPFTLSNPACNLEITQLTVTNSSTPTSNNGSVSFVATGNYCGTRYAQLLRENTPGVYSFYATMTSGGGNTYSASNLPTGNYKATLGYTPYQPCNDTAAFTISVQGCTVTPSVTPNGPLAFCPGGQVQLTASPAQSYLWNNGATSSTITVTAPGSYTVSVVTATGCTGTSNPVIVSHLPVPVSYALSGGGVVCPGATSGVDIIQSGSQAGTTYTLHRNGIATAHVLSGNGTAITFANINLAGVYTVFASNTSGCTATMNGPVTITENPAISISFTTQPGTCNQPNGAITASVSGGTGTLSGLWSNNQTGFSLQNVAAGTYTLTVTDAISCQSSQQVQLLNSINTPVAASVINGPQGACKGQNNVTFSVNPIADAATYNWTLPAGATGSSTTNSITVNFSTTFNGGNICVSASNICGTGPATCLNLQVFTVSPSTPSVINGPVIEVCAGSTKTYSTPVISNATSYNWTAPNNSTITSGQGTPTVTIAFNASFLSGSITVRAQNCKGLSGTRTLAVYGKPAMPASITGPINEVCGGSTVNYSCPVTNGATAYNWTVPSGCIINSGQGTNTVNVTFPTGYLSGNVSVNASSSCGTSTNRSVTVRSVPAQPGTITGTSVNLCGGGTYTYSIAAVPGTISYYWTVPAGCTITTGGNGTSITVNISGAFTSGSICVSAINGCGYSTSRCLALSRNPAIPAAISGPATVCSGQTGISYSTTAIAGLTYTWTVPAGATITSGQGTAAITVNWGTSAGNVVVKANNACGSSGNRTLAVSVTGCREDVSDVEKDENIDTEPDYLNTDVHAYPNPVKNELIINWQMADVQVVQFRMYDISGKLVWENEPEQFTQGNQQLILPMGHLESGLYFLEKVSQGQAVQRLKIIKS